MIFNIKKFIHYRPFFCFALVCIFLIFISIILRRHELDRTVGSQNLEASYHTLLTIRALKENSIKDHYLLPTVTLGDPNDKFIPWGATLPTKNGSYIYTSFYSPAFLAPYFFFHFLNLDINLKNLECFNFLLNLLCTLLLYGLIYKILRNYKYDTFISAVSSFVSVVISIFSVETLRSHGLIYWAQSFYQLIFISNLFYLYLVLTTKDHYRKYYYIKMLIGLVFLGALVEWTGYIYGAGLVILFWFGILGKSRDKSLSQKLFFSLFVSGVLLVTHYSAALGFSNLINTILNRFIARQITHGSFIQLTKEYYNSYSTFIILLCLSSCFLVYKFLIKKSLNRKLLLSNNSTLIFFGLACTIPLIENIIMLQHSIQFSFDRLKIIPIAALIFSLTFVQIKSKILRFGFFLLDHY